MTVNKKLLNSEHKVIQKEEEVKTLREKMEIKKTEEVKNKVKTSDCLKCNLCSFGGMNQNDLERHKTVKHNSEEDPFKQFRNQLYKCRTCKQILLW